MNTNMDASGGAEITLEKVDCIRERAGLSYEDAVEYLRQAGGDVVEALVLIERDMSAQRTRLIDKGSEIIEAIKDVIHKGNETKIKIRQNDKTLVELPVTAGVVGAMIAPQLAALGALAALATKCSISLEGPEPGPAGSPSPGSPGGVDN
ncbi:MAG TPA: DUF4342 domain-containing protein [Firmicutes bacterium]|nr:DUF4342 domain-containing protein [Bacillota bacterium]